MQTYLWEIVKGPITDHLENNQGAMLKLKDLTHGNYSVQLTVTDAEGLTNSTQAVVMVEEVSCWQQLMILAQQVTYTAGTPIYVVLHISRIFS